MKSGGTARSIASQPTVPAGGGRPSPAGHPDKVAEAGRTLTGGPTWPAYPGLSPDDPTHTHDPTRDPAAGTVTDQRDSIQVRDPARYHILGEHGRGGLGRVSRARDRELGRDIAIKELISRGQVSEVRFLREALITARLEHPGIVPVYEAGRWSDGTPFYAMKLVAGRSLRDLIAERRSVDERIGLLHHVIAVADAIAYAHGKNIIHRDLKPANVIVGEFGETVVIDWGLAKDLTLSEDSGISAGASASGGRLIHDDGLTSVGTILGTPAYMAPEQERGESVDQRADVYAIGIMLWELCSLDKLPTTSAALRRKILRRTGIDQDLATIIDKALAPDQASRYPSAAALAADLKAFKAGARIAARHYSPWAMFTHWTRRHRALATSVVAIVLAAAIGIALYVRNIAVERDRADAALAAAERERAAAAAQRDRAQLSEAAMWLEKDPTHARDLLRVATARSPQRALLLSESEGRAATRVVHLPAMVFTLAVTSAPAEAQIVTQPGELFRLDLETGALRPIARDLTGPLIKRNGQWCYPSWPVDRAATIATGCGPLGELGTLLRRQTGQLISAPQTLYALDASQLYRLDADKPVLLRKAIHGFAASATATMICGNDGRLEITVNGKRLPDTTCAPNESEAAVAATADHYVALQSPTQLISERGVIPLATAAHGEFSLVLGADGLIGFADFTGDAWLVRPGQTKAEQVAVRTAHPTGIAAEGTFVAFGYADGGVVVADTATGQRWEFIGHDAPVFRIGLDTAHRRVVSAADQEVRVWDLSDVPMHTTGPLPCFPSHLIPLHGSGLFATDCSDGEALVWNPDSDQITSVHHHRDIALGIVEHRGQVCTGGWDGRVLCTPPGGGATSELLAAERVRSLASCGDDLFVATSDGAIWRAGPDPHILYKHHADTYRIATSSDCTRLVSGAFDGSLIVYDLAHHRVALEAPHAHAGQVTSVIVRGDELYTGSLDGTVKHWHIGTSLELRNTRTLAGPVMRLQVFGGGWAAAVDGRTFVLHSDTRPELALSLNAPIAEITLSPDEQYVAVAAPGKIVIVDRQHDTLAAAYHPGDINCVRFISPTMIAACERSAISSLSLTSMRFSAMSAN